MIEAELLIQSKYTLGEGPVWDDTRGELIWVDIEKCLLCIYTIKNRKLLEIKTDSRIGAVVPMLNTDSYLLALQSGLKIYNRSTGQIQFIANPEEHIKNNRFNDGKCDPIGRFWIGSMDLNATKGKGNLYCLDNNVTISRKLDNVSISNGIAWSMDQQHMYFIDTLTQNVVRFDYHKETAQINSPETVIQVPEKYGSPDGMCIDNQGMLWIANWGGGKIVRWNPENGEMLQKISVPAPNVTSCCFGGSKLDTLFITTARIGLSKQQLQEFPLSGSVFQVQTGSKGCITNFFRKSE